MVILPVPALPGAVEYNVPTLPPAVKYSVPTLHPAVRVHCTPLPGGSRVQYAGVVGYNGLFAPTLVILGSEFICNKPCHSRALETGLRDQLVRNFGDLGDKYNLFFY